MKKIFTIGMLLILSINYIQAQTASIISGKIIDQQTLEPIVGAVISNLEGNLGTVSDINGNFNLEADMQTLKISNIGYEAQEVSASSSVVVKLKPSMENLQTVIVTANREASLRTSAPIAISKLSSKVIDETKATSLYELVNKTPGVLMVNLGNEQHSMAIRQPMTTNAYYLYLEDGLPIRPLGVFNHNALLEINQFTLSSVEVVKGPVSSIYGAEAIGGAVNLIGQRPTAVPSAKVGIQFDQFGYKRLQFGTGMMTGKKFGFYIGGVISQQKDGWITSSDYDKTNITARFEYQINDKSRLTFSNAYGKYYSQTSGSVDSVAFYSRQYVSTTDFTYRKSDAIRSSLRWDHDWSKNASTFLTAFYRNNKLGQNPSYGIRWTSGAATARGEINSSNFESYGLLAQHAQKFSFLNSKLIAGALFDYSPNDYWSYQIDLNAQLRADKKSVEKYTIAKERPDIELANYEAQINNLGVYLQYDLNPIEKLRISTGLRLDNMSFDYINNLDKGSGNKSYRQISPKVGFTYEIHTGIGLYANFSKGFSPPSLTSIFRKRPAPTDAGDLFYYNLEPAQFDNFEVGTWFSIFKNKIYVDLAAYLMKGRNELLNIRQADNSFDYQSAGKTSHKGIEFGLSYKPSETFNFRFGGTYAKHYFDEFILSLKSTDAIKDVNGKEMPSAPNTTWNTEVTYRPGWLKGFRSSVEWQHISGFYQNQINTIKGEGYDVFNVRFGYTYKFIEVFTNIMNATDQLYAFNTSRGNNATDRSSFTAAAPRTFVVGIQYNFVGK
ncbi:MAG: TonB-dependent receptor [Saprospiraceae bacterium]